MVGVLTPAVALLMVGAAVPGISGISRVPAANISVQKSAAALPEQSIQERIAVSAEWRAIAGSTPEWPLRLPLPEFRRAALVELRGIGDVEAALGRIAALRAEGIRTVFTAWSPLPGEELPEPEALADAIRRVASQADGFALAWHRSGAHFIRPNAGVMAFLASAAREGNPSVALLGEAYRGESYAGADTLAVNAPECVSAVLLCNAVRSPGMTAIQANRVKRKFAGPVIPVVPDGLMNRYQNYRRILVISIDNTNN